MFVGVFVAAYLVLTLLSITTASTEHASRTFPAVGELRVATGSGDVTVVGEARANVRVEAEIQRGMWRGAWRPDTDLRLVGGRLQVASHCSLWAHIGVSDCGASFVIHVPRNTRVHVDASSGDVTVRSVRAAVAAHASSGDLRAEGVSGPLTLDASSGDLTVERFAGPRLDAQASSGDVDLLALRAPRSIRVVASSGDVSLLVPDAVYRVATDTSSGDEDVQVRQSPDAVHRIDVRASSGDVSIARLVGAR